MAARMNNSVSATIPLPLAARLGTAVVSLLLGAFLIYGVGIAHSDALHDSAHDTRHSYGFPCH
ncbi:MULTISPECIES: CbtB domain-containing protein [Brucella/Ochrobactrum group]|uniref:CbtB-domain containing protein n=2 Tax=Ochrobactrum TaxID=528 RepID=A0A2P9HNQ6_9HYPH|nr:MULTISPECIES: CbtB domain-containing protein [Brucella]MCI1001296.1 CbtB-domain containing protein [Ochrobactrum sp. C6C9]WHT42284.1 CbtB domain-containing protein [Ochrobactrum sp. SSR]MDX4072461.1 CbtB domain-containing protein [Brucella sp. NBRC 113783]NNU61364.1 CbtB-domain containing protein [[Ochrobactrum] soli]RLL75719.1 cobalt transporter [[Ochrobactrum] soli]